MPLHPSCQNKGLFFFPLNLAFAAISTELLASKEPPACLGVSLLFDFTWNPDFPAVSIPWAKYLLRIVHLLRRGNGFSALCSGGAGEASTLIR